MIANAPTLMVEDLKTYFYTKAGVAKAVDGVSFSVGKGEVLGLVGESGSGKSVTGFSIIGLVQVNNRPDLYSGKGMAIAGLITSALSLLLGIGGLALNWHEFVQELQNA